MRLITNKFYPLFETSDFEEINTEVLREKV